MDFTEISRVVVIVGYATIAVAGVLGILRATLYNHKLAAMSAIVIGTLWSVFYLVVWAHAPLTPDELVLATYMSRVNHLPVIAAIGIMLYTQRRAEQTIVEVRKQSDAQDVS